MNTVIVWIRNDLRLHDNPALYHALQTGHSVVCVYIHSEHLGMASKLWLDAALDSFQRDLKANGLELKIYFGKPLEVFEKLSVQALYWNRRYEPHLAAEDAKIQKKFRNVEIKTFQGNVLFEPGTILSREGRPYQVFTPFWNTISKLDSPRPLSRLNVEPQETTCKWHFAPYWTPTEREALKRMEDFVNSCLIDYAQARDFPALNGTSKLSPYLHFGQLSIRTLWHACSNRGADAFLRELGFREFAMQLLHHYPKLPHEPLREEFRAFCWSKDKSALQAWQEGKTGYPIVDAGMRELLATGWMHNRVRMIAGSFLVKQLLLPWQEGEQWFWEHLVDADLANNSFNWQWVAGCGADAAPYFRIFNPILQGKKFDPEGHYIRTWIPELKSVPTEHIHTPWLAHSTYPKPIVDLVSARKRALQAFHMLTNKRLGRS